MDAGRAIPSTGGDRLRFEGEARSRLAGTRFEQLGWLAECGSTNSLLMDEARAGAPEQVLVADVQTAGRGRLGRVWQAPRGASLLCSFLVRPEPGRGPADGHLLTTALGVAAAEACREVAGVEAMLKWPNDVIVDDAKLAGILAEATVSGGRPCFVIGIGLNVNWPPDLPDDLASRATALNHLAGRSIDRVDLLVSMVGAFAERIGDLEAGGAAKLRGDYLSLCATIGREVRVEQTAGALVGTAVDVDDSGRLVMDVEGREVCVSVGDVVHLRPA